jgi:hypothetical protein
LGPRRRVRRRGRPGKLFSRPNQIVAHENHAYRPQRVGWSR